MRSSPRPTLPGSPATSSRACWRANSGAPSPACGWRSGVRQDLQHHGIGTLLLDALATWARRHGIRDLRTQSAWNDHGMLHWLDAMHFSLAPNHIVDCAVAWNRFSRNTGGTLVEKCCHFFDL